MTGKETRRHGVTGDGDTMRPQEIRGRGDGETGRHDHQTTPVAPSARPPVPASLRLPVPASPRLRVPASAAIVALALTTLSLVTVGTGSLAQRRRANQDGSHSSHLRESLSPEARETVERAIDVVCTERKKDPKQRADKVTFSYEIHDGEAPTT